LLRPSLTEVVWSFLYYWRAWNIFCASIFDFYIFITLVLPTQQLHCKISILIKQQRKAMAHFVYPTANPMAQVAAPPQAYPTAQSAYVAAAPQAAYAATAAPPRAGQTYEGYPASATTAVHQPTQYAYSRAQVAVTTAFPLQPTVTYDQSKAYYQPAAATTYTVAAEPQFQTVGVSLPAAKSVFSTGTPFASPQRPTTVAPKAPAVPVSSTGTSYVYSSASPAVTTYSPSGYSTTATPQNNISGYDAALYSAATNFYSQQQQGKTGSASWILKKTALGNQFKPKPKGPPKAPQLHYCDVCKISCAGPQTYREHLEGQKHKKKEAAMKVSQPAGRRSHNQMRCELCDVTCTGQDAYAAHIRGSKHQKVFKLHTKLGKPIPSTELPSKATSKPATNKIVVPAGSTEKVLATPKINFLGGSQLKTLGPKGEDVKAAEYAASINATVEAAAAMSDGETEDSSVGVEKDVAPIGHEYIEEIKDDGGKIGCFNCKLCDCKFNDPNAKEMHLKGRRHRLQYKKKVDPSLQVDVKPSIRVRKIQEDKLRRQSQKEEFWRLREQQEHLREEMR
jgi:zinc finger RNA-binding protein